MVLLLRRKTKERTTMNRACAGTIHRKVKVKFPLCFNWAPCHGGVLGEWRYSSTQSVTSALDGGAWSASRPGHFTPRERAPGTHWIGGWVDPRAVRGRGGEEKNSQPQPWFIRSERIISQVVSANPCLINLSGETNFRSSKVGGNNNCLAESHLFSNWESV
jgi:hypothetical protein